MTDKLLAIHEDFLETVKKNTAGTIALGVILLVLGFMAMASPMIAGLSVAMMVGIMLVIGGVAQLVFAIKSKEGVLAIVLGILTIVLGGYMLANLGVALASLTIILASYLIVSGILEGVMAIQIRPVKGWGWTLFSGILSVVLGVMIWSQFPLSGAWAVGILLGVRLIFSGWTLIMLALAARGAVSEMASPA